MSGSRKSSCWLTGDSILFKIHYIEFQFRSHITKTVCNQQRRVTTGLHFCKLLIFLSNWCRNLPVETKWTVAFSHMSWSWWSAVGIKGNHCLAKWENPSQDIFFEKSCILRKCFNSWRYVNFWTDQKHLLHPFNEVMFATVPCRNHDSWHNRRITFLVATLQ